MCCVTTISLDLKLIIMIPLNFVNKEYFKTPDKPIELIFIPNIRIHVSTACLFKPELTLPAGLVLRCTGKISHKASKLDFVVDRASSSMSAIELIDKSSTINYTLNVKELMKAIKKGSIAISDIPITEDHTFVVNDTFTVPVPEFTQSVKYYKDDRYRFSHFYNKRLMMFREMGGDKYLPMSVNAFKFQVDNNVITVYEDVRTEMVKQDIKVVDTNSNTTMLEHCYTKEDIVIHRLPDLTDSGWPLNSPARIIEDNRTIGEGITVSTLNNDVYSFKSYANSLIKIVNNQGTSSTIEYPIVFPKDITGYVVEKPFGHLEKGAILVFLGFEKGYQMRFREKELVNHLLPLKDVLELLQTGFLKPHNIHSGETIEEESKLPVNHIVLKTGQVLRSNQHYAELIKKLDGTYKWLNITYKGKRTNIPSPADNIAFITEEIEEDGIPDFTNY